MKKTGKGAAMSETKAYLIFALTFTAGAIFIDSVAWHLAVQLSLMVILFCLLAAELITFLPRQT